VPSGKPLSRRSWCLILSLAWILHNSEEWLLAPQMLTLLVQARRQRWTPTPAFLAVAPVAVLVHGPVLDALFKVRLSLVRAA
jgi:hypothetical protein